MSDELSGPDPGEWGGGEESLSGPAGIDAGGPASSPLDDHLWVFSDGSIWDLGPAQVDADADGVAESLTRSASGEVVVYSDRDLDGLVDRITHWDPSGDYRVSDLDPDDGSWSGGTLGRLD
ncbi:MAG: hypothetical protein QM774_12050 [Gordonia sp. (in: high G+C Gram-positive bacteria)]|uniref:DUF6802 family protein n=1 Tax=Gordonia sp. (in: high G+C Gram-positive bacteria) TaxID=84139 RepID=UPI0039E4E694